MRGRRPKSTRQRTLEGNPGHRPLNPDEPQPAAPDAAPLRDPFDQAPAALTGNGRAIAEWERVAPLLRRARQITDADTSALIALCLAWSQYLDAVAHSGTPVIRTANGYPLINPYLAIANKALGACIRLWEQLGLTPSARSRVASVPLGRNDPFAEFDDPLD